MLIDEIRAHKGQVLLDHQECEDHVAELSRQLRILSGTIERFSRLLDPGERSSPRVPDLKQLQADEFQAALNHESALRLAEELAQAFGQLEELARKKREFGLR
jgi:hypothetical protein